MRFAPPHSGVDAACTRARAYAASVPSAAAIHEMDCGVN